MGVRIAFNIVDSVVLRHAGQRQEEDLVLHMQRRLILFGKCIRGGGGGGGESSSSSSSSRLQSQERIFLNGRSNPNNRSIGNKITQQTGSE
jgi:hypothetical protein